MGIMKQYRVIPVVVFILLFYSICYANDKKDVFINSIGMEFVYIPQGTFLMGSPKSELCRRKDEMQHRVIINKDYYLQRTEVTQRQWQSVMGNNPSYFKDYGNDYPVENVSWLDVQEFLKKLNAMDKDNIYRLPTEAEWEYACRAGATTRYSWGDEADCSKANYGNSPLARECATINPGHPSPVGSYQKNSWGLYDMHGNVWEWCADWYGAYKGAKAIDPRGPDHGTYRVVRGGAYFDPVASSRSANRCWDPPDYRVQDIGFRLVRFPVE